ncbi:Glycoside hydrolase, 38 vacuolar alpha mannosidase [Coemansia guatemalensis]|uniref:Glycoside hydrolase, 38 vacuolar alpha mannosidase n=1 Tax=Coemansia guatemalensis TaxID=2761395 RepID=A0A9W8HL08_9FUNG|nr:Glycoside hydrolase, 38 vacuolar alpha mannosidase [Coemansia guatemalensis]
MGHHTFRYAVYPHQGSFNESSVVREAYQFNLPLVQLPVDFGAVSESTNIAGTKPLFTVEGAPNVVLDTVKKAEDGDGHIIVRLYEAYGGRAKATLSTSLDVAGQAHLTNILEEPTDSVNLVASAAGRMSAEIALKPFQIITLRLALRN